MFTIQSFYHYFNEKIPSITGKIFDYWHQQDSIPFHGNISHNDFSVNIKYLQDEPIDIIEFIQIINDSQIIQPILYNQTNTTLSIYDAVLHHDAVVLHDDVIPHHDDNIISFVIGYYLLLFIFIAIIIYLEFILIHYLQKKESTAANRGRYRHICRGKSLNNRRCRRCVKNTSRCYQHE
jgi:hypothetical protein